MTSLCSLSHLNVSIECLGSLCKWTVNRRIISDDFLFYLFPELQIRRRRHPKRLQVSRDGQRVGFYRQLLMSPKSVFLDSP